MATDATNKPAGPGAVEPQGIQPDSLLTGASEYEYVTVLNPLSVDFYGKVGVSRPVNVPFQVHKDQYSQTVTSNESDVIRNYGLSLKNKDHPAQVNITNRILIPAGKTINLLGNEAQVVVKQLVDEIMQREKNSLLLADMFHRREVEERVVIARRSVNDFLGTGVKTVESQLREAVNELNKEEVKEDEREFPSIEDATSAAATDLGASPKPSPARA